MAERTDQPCGPAFLGNRIEARTTERVAAQEASQAEQRAVGGTMTIDRLARVFGAARLETASRAEER